MTAEEYIALHREEDVRMLALGRVPDGVDFVYCLQQIEGWQLARKKLPKWASLEGIRFPVRLSMEQCSSEATAMYKRAVVERLLPLGRKRMADMTGGFGIDFSYMAESFDEALYVEHQESLCQIARHNFPLLGLCNAEVRCAKGESLLDGDEHYSLLYLDPARRDGAGRKVVGLEDCTPDITVLHDKLLDKADAVMVKLSPMLDIRLAQRQLTGVREVHVVSVDGECKELLLVMSKNAQRVVFYCANIIGTGTHVFATEDNHPTPVICEKVGAYLYEPNASILKAGVQDALCERMGVEKLHPFSNLFTSDVLVEGFPGRAFRIEGQSDFGKRSLRAILSSLQKANLTVRNFPTTVADLRKKWKLREGGDDYLFATTLSDGSHALFLCKKV